MIHWSAIDPQDATGLDLTKRLDIVAPLNEAGERCPWPWDPQQLAGAPMGQYHCPFCGAMVLAGVPHLDYREAPHSEHKDPDPGCNECFQEATWINPDVWPLAAARPDAVAVVRVAFGQVLDLILRGGSARDLAVLAVEALALHGALPEAADTEEEWVPAYTVTDADGSKPLTKDADRSESDHGTFESRAEAERHMLAWASHYAGLAYRDVTYHRRVRWTGPWMAAE